MAFENYPFEARLPLGYADDVYDHPGGTYAAPYDRGSYRPSVRAPFLQPPRPVPMRSRSYESGYCGHDGYGGSGRNAGYGGGYHPGAELRRSSRLGGPRARGLGFGAHGGHYPPASRGLMMESHYGHGAYGHGY